MRLLILQKLMELAGISYNAHIRSRLLDVGMTDLQINSIPFSGNLSEEIGIDMMQKSLSHQSQIQEQISSMMHIDLWIV